jgi:hypothetical protein
MFFGKTNNLGNRSNRAVSLREFVCYIFLDYTNRNYKAGLEKSGFVIKLSVRSNYYDIY